jgi:uncharacterized protein involved in outer membrane biogenesis
VLAGVTLEVSRWCDAAAARATAALGRPVVLEGPVQLKLGREAVLRVSGVEVLNPPGFTTNEFAALGEARVRFDLLDAVRGSLHVRDIEASAGRLRLERTVDGRPNWSFAAAPSAARPFGITVEVADITLRNLDVEYHDARAAKRLRFAVDELTASGQWDAPLRRTP